VSAKACSHSKEKRSLLDGYEVVCECGKSIGRVALFPCAVLPIEQARAVLADMGEPSSFAGRDGRAVLEMVARS
jgi:hypothetical protein